MANVYAKMDIKEYLGFVPFIVLKILWKYKVYVEYVLKIQCITQVIKFAIVKLDIN
jgi:hypothetical protein